MEIRRRELSPRRDFVLDNSSVPPADRCYLYYTLLRDFVAEELSDEFYIQDLNNKVGASDDAPAKSFSDSQIAQQCNVASDP
jgi:hypothetical protein